MSELPYDAHVAALQVSGYTIVRDFVAPDELEQLRTGADRALDASFAAIRAGHHDLFVLPEEYLAEPESAPYGAARCLYAWGDAFVRLLEDPRLERLLEPVMGRHQLWDMPLLVAMPAADHHDDELALEWHRDVLSGGGELAAFVWCFVCLDDAAPENGATWYVPGSHRLRPAGELPTTGGGRGPYPSAIQLCGRAGDLLILNPHGLHAVGRNTTASRRRLLNLGFVTWEAWPLLDHWTIAGPAVQERAGDRLRTLLGTGGGLGRTWPALPEGWKTG